MNLIDKLNSIAMELEAVGLIIDNDSSEYFSTPLNSIIIAHTGVDGVHFCSAKGEKGIDDSPVFVISPMMPDHYVEVVGRDLVDFLSLVVRCKDANSLECISYMSEDKFRKHLENNSREILNSPGFNIKVEKAISSLEALFELKEIDNVYKHVMETKTDSKYHVELLFSQEYYNLTT